MLTGGYYRDMSGQKGNSRTHLANMHMTKIEVAHIVTPTQTHTTFFSFVDASRCNNNVF